MKPNIGLGNHDDFENLKFWKFIPRFNKIYQVTKIQLKKDISPAFWPTSEFSKFYDPSETIWTVPKFTKLYTNINTFNSYHIFTK